MLLNNHRRLVRVRFYCVRRLININTVQYFSILPLLEKISIGVHVKKSRPIFFSISTSLVRPTVSARRIRKNIVASKTLYLNNNSWYSMVAIPSDWGANHSTPIILVNIIESHSTEEFRFTVKPPVFCFLKWQVRVLWCSQFQILWSSVACTKHMTKQL